MFKEKSDRLKQIRENPNILPELDKVTSEEIALALSLGYQPVKEDLGKNMALFLSDAVLEKAFSQDPSCLVFF